MYESISDLVNVIAKFFIDETIYESYFQTLCYETNDLLLIYWATFLVVPVLGTITFHKLWDPVNNGKGKLALTFLFIFLVVVGIVYYELFNNSTLDLEIEAFLENDQYENPYYFIFPYGLVFGLFSLTVSFILAHITRFISTNNNKIPNIFSLFKKS